MSCLCTIPAHLKGVPCVKYAYLSDQDMGLAPFHYSNWNLICIFKSSHVFQVAMKRWSFPEAFIDFKQKDMETASKGNGKKE